LSVRHISSWQHKGIVNVRLAGEVAEVPSSRLIHISSWQYKAIVILRMAGEVPKVPSSDPTTTQNNGNHKNGNWKQAQYPNPPESGGNWKHARYPNPPDPHNPDLATLREQWKVAIRQYSRWSSQAWSAAIFAGISLFALGWFIKGSNPLPSISTSKSNENNNYDQDKPRPSS